MLSDKLELILSVLDDPKTAVEAIVLKRPVLLSILVFALANFSIAVSRLISAGAGGEHLVMKFMLYFAFNAAVFILCSCVLHFTAGLLNGRGDIVALYSALNFSLTPLLLLIPAALIGKFAGGEISFLLTVFLYCWALGFVIYAVQTLYGVHGGAAAAIVFSPLIAVLLIFFAVSVMIFGTVAALIL